MAPRAIPALLMMLMLTMAVPTACRREARDRSYQSLSDAEKASCDVYAEQAERFARGREGGISLEDHLKAVEVSCTNRPQTCAGFRLLVADVHGNTWPVADAGTRVRENCDRYVLAPN